MKYPLKRWLPFLLLMVAGVLAYWNSFDGVFLFDDFASIRDNPYIRVLWPLSRSMSLPLSDTGLTVDGRPLLSLSFALNHWLFGPEPWGYHLVNLLIHLTAGLLLFGIVRRTLELPQFRERYAQSGTWLALASALIWLVHPLQTESVTYIVQRAESLMGMLFLLTLYCAIRGFTGAKCGRWYLAAVLVCACGMGVKEIMFSAPLLVLLYDYIFNDGLAPGGLALGERGLQREGHVARARRARGWFYAALCSTWSIVFWITVSGWSEATNYLDKISPLRYAMTQPLVLLYYLRLVIWPSPLVMSYAWPYEDQWIRAVFPTLAILGMLAVMFHGIRRRTWYGYVAAWFFLILAPTSTIMPLQHPIFEHRMYLPLAAVVILVVVGAESAIRKLVSTPKQQAIVGGCLAMAVLTAFGFLTHDRNRDYHSELSMWNDNILHCPDSSPAHLDLGNALLALGRHAEAISHYREALRLKPDSAEAYNNLGNTMLEQGRPAEAIAHYQEALRLKPALARVHSNLGNALQKVGRTDEAVAHYEQSLRINPEQAEIQNKLGNALQGSAGPAKAIPHYLEALRIDPGSAEAHNNLGNAMQALGRTAKAIRHYEDALRANPAYAEVHFNLGRAMQALGRTGEAIGHYQQAVVFKPDMADAHYNLGNAMVPLGRTDEAIDHYRQAVQLKPDHVNAHNNLGAMYREGGRLAEAIKHFEQAARLKPDSTMAQENLRLTREMMKRGMKDEG